MSATIMKAYKALRHHLTFGGAGRMRPGLFDALIERKKARARGIIHGANQTKSDMTLVRH
jgi:hypothetical protein